jgi:hypothetical protein
MLETLQFKPAPHLLLWSGLDDINLLRAFIWYVTVMFFLGMLLRLRFYHSLMIITQHVSNRCPNVTDLLRQHWVLCLANGIVPRALTYGLIVALYVILNHFVWPQAEVHIPDLAQPYAEHLVWNILLVGLMVTVDLWLIVQVTVIDVGKTIQDISLAERWLGGSVNQLLKLLGSWNPIDRYAASTTKQMLEWLNAVTHNSIGLLILQVAIRLWVAGSLYSSFYFIKFIQHPTQVLIDLTS